MVNVWSGECLGGERLTIDSITGSLIQLKTLQDIYFLNADYPGHTFIIDSNYLSQGLGSRIELKDQSRGLV